MALKFKNNATSVLTSSFNIGATSLTITASHGARFPTLGVGDYFYATLEDGANNIEVIKVTAIVNDTLSGITRAIDGTTERNWVAGDAIENRLTASALNEFSNTSVSQTWSGNQTFNGDVSAGAIAKAEPKTDGTLSLGAVTKRWLNVFLNGVIRWGSGGNTVSLSSEVSTTGAKTVVVPAQSGTIALLDSPEFTGTPKVPTAAAGTSTTQAASTAFVRQELLGRRSVWVPAFTMQNAFNAVTAAAIATADLANGVQLRAFSFTETGEPSVFFQMLLPKAWNRGAIRWRPYWYSPGSVVAGSVVWSLKAVAMGSGEGMATATSSSTVTAPYPGGSHVLSTSSESTDFTIAGTPQANDMILFRVGRLGDDAADTMNSAAVLLGVMLYYTVDALKDD